MSAKCKNKCKVSQFVLKFFASQRNALNTTFKRRIWFMSPHIFVQCRCILWEIFRQTLENVKALSFFIWPLRPGRVGQGLSDVIWHRKTTMKPNNVSRWRCLIKIEIKNGNLTDIAYFTCMVCFCDVCCTCLGTLIEFIILGKQFGDHIIRPKRIFRTWVFWRARNPLCMVSEPFPASVEFLFLTSRQMTAFSKLKVFTWHWQGNSLWVR